MEIKELLLEDRVPEALLAEYELKPQVPAFYLSKDGIKILQIEDEKVVIPMIPVNDRDINDLVHTVIVTAAMGNKEYMAPSIEKALEIIKSELKLKDLSFDAALTNSRMNLPITESFTKVAYCDEIPTNVIYGLPEDGFLGKVAYQCSNFGILVHNSDVIVRVTIQPN